MNRFIILLVDNWQISVFNYFVFVTLLTTLLNDCCETGYRRLIFRSKQLILVLVIPIIVYLFLLPFFLKDLQII